MNTRSDERGVVSILTVMFFVILLSILTVAFLRIMSDEQEQVIGDDLTKGALASARSGVEDAKRALLYCRAATGSDKTNCESALNANCPGIFSGATASASMNSALAISPGANGTVQVGGNPELNQRYTCLKVQRDTADVTGVAEENLGDFVELNTNGAGFDTISLSWHRLGGTYDGPAGLDSRINPKFGAAGDLNPQTTSWANAASSVSYPALLRVQVLEYDAASNLTALAQKQMTAYFLPVTGGETTAAVNGVVATSSGLNRNRYFANCTTIGDYSCSISLTGIVTDPTKRYFIRLSTKYRSTHYKVELKSGGVLGSGVLLRDVQPIIDSTGAADDTYRRILTRVQYGSSGYYTDNALESGESLCKSFYVTNTAAVGIGTCTGLAP